MIGLAITVYCCRVMGRGLPMPGGWTLSMMWMRMPGQNRLAAAAQFLAMWLGMVSAMMLPLLVPVFLHTQRRHFLYPDRRCSPHPERHHFSHTERRWMSLCLMAGGYYTVWLTTGLAVYGIGTAMAEWTLHSDQPK
jgi:predicted metal-binding membrane protein